MNYQEIKISIYGTNVKIKLLHENADKILNNCISLLKKYNKVFSMYDENSELYRLNKNASKKPFYASDELFDLINVSKYFSKYNNSMLNICIGPLVNLWKIGQKDARVPSQIELDEAIKNIDIDDLILDEHNKTIFFNNENMKIDLGATAKGYIADKLMDYIKSEKTISAIVNLGGNILTHGFNLESSDLNWRIGLQYPNKIRGSHAMMLELNDLSIVTSGVYERKLIFNGKKYHHIFDSQSGYPIDSEMESISIIGAKSVHCDIFSTVLFGKIFDNIVEEIEKNNNLEAIAIYKNDIIKYTNGVEKYILWKDEK